jgi:hypothetical protein
MKKSQQKKALKASAPFNDVVDEFKAFLKRRGLKWYDLTYTEVVENLFLFWDEVGHPDISALPIPDSSLIEGEKVVISTDETEGQGNY